MNIKSHGGGVALTLFHSFHYSQETGIQDGYGNARRQSFDSVRIKLAKTNCMYLGLSLRDFSSWRGANCSFFTVSFFYLLFMNFSFIKESVHDGGIKRRVGYD